MALSSVIFNTGNGALGNFNAGSDAPSALLFGYDVPVSWTKPIRPFTNIKQVEAAGIAENNAYGLSHYQVSEYFRNGGGKLYIGFDTSSVISAVDSLILMTDGDVRQIGIMIGDWSHIGVLAAKSAILQAQHYYHVPIIAGYFGSFDVANAPNLRNYNAATVSVLPMGDGSASTLALLNALGHTYMPAFGAVLGAVSKSNVHENIGWVNKFNLSNNVLLETTNFPDGTSNPPESVLEALQAKGYMVLRKHNGIAGTYVADTPTCTDELDDFANIERNRVMGKAKRLLRKALLPHLNAPLYVDAQGRFSKNTIKEFEGFCNIAMTVMQRAQEVSAYSIYIDPNQNVLQTSTLEIALEIVPVGVGRTLVVNIGYAVKLSN